jgi:plastocyanin
MNKIYIVVGLLVIVGLVWFFTDSKTNPTPEAPNEIGVSSETEHAIENEPVAAETGGTENVEDSSGSSEEATSTEKVFTLDSFNFGYSETEIRVKEGDTVTINLTNSEGFHDWVVDEFSAATEKIREGGETSVTFVADESGTFEYYCSVGSHRAAGMVGSLIVE